MKRFLYAAAFLAPFICQAQVRIEAEGYAVFHHEEGTVPEGTIFAQRDLKGRKGVYGWGRAEHLRNDNRGDASGGVTYRMGDNVHIGAGIGMHRSVALLMAYQNEKSKAKGFGMFEHGGEGSWHIAEASYPVRNFFVLGFLSESHLGIGPRIEHELGPVSVWYAVLREIRIGNTNHVLGISYDIEDLCIFGHRQ